ncbi:unnamed protein product [Chironomus riparius]|uniref:Uncharacterized protein n=1 Tax=Chironomus riparius TaxID=315576 RepID=A0A9N9WYE9_9DIPT|nr:unnamed protein product [Chironomus riparius]
MKGVFIALALFAVSTHAQTVDCPDCGPPIVPPNCEQPECWHPQNQQNHALFPHTDPNFYWQCAPQGVPAVWAPMARPCACGTHFNPNVFPPRCTFWFERSWQPICGWTRPPPMRPCEPWCPDCGDQVTGAPPPPITPTTTVTVTPPTPTPPTCNCPCVPCIWWPCIPCNPCAC